MNINEKVQEMINTYHNPTLLEIAPQLYRELTEDTLGFLKNRNIKIEVTNKVKTIEIHNYKTDCFAYKDKKCIALTKIDCYKCKFYKERLQAKEEYLDNFTLYTASNIQKNIDNYFRKEL